MSISINIKYLREKHEMTQEQLAEKLDVARSTVTQWERGWSNPRMGMIQRIAGVFGVSVSEIVSDNPTIPDNAIPQSTPTKRAYIPLLGRVHAGDVQEPDVIDAQIPVPYEVWKRRAARDLDLLNKLKDEAKTSEEMEIVESYKRQIFKLVDKGLYRPERVHTKTEAAFLKIPGTIISIVEVLFAWGLPAVITGNPFEGLYIWIVVLFGICLDVIINHSRKKERENLNAKQNVKKDSSYEIETTKSK